MLRQTSWVDDANTKIHIADVLTSIGVNVPDSVWSGGTKKVYCPFGFYHSDRGFTKAMRVYGSKNAAYCFSCSKRYGPVSLAAAHWDTSWVNAAFRLLEDAGFKPKSLEERWRDAVTEVENKPDLIALADALKMYCSGICPTWQATQLDDIVATKLSKCLNLLNAVVTDEDAAKWLNTTKLVMRRALEVDNDKNYAAG
jgi:hypothetical protein